MGDEQDRLMRCVRDETRLAPRIGVNGKVKYFDPIERMTFGTAKQQIDHQMSGILQSQQI